MSNHPRIVITFDITTPESAAEGCNEDSGWEDEAGIPCLDDNSEVPVSAVEFAAGFIKNVRPEASSSCFHPGIWYMGQPDQDFRTGAEKTLSYHLKDFSEADQLAIYKLVTGKDR